MRSRTKGVLAATVGVIVLLVAGVVGSAVVQVRGEVAKLVAEDPAVWLPVIESFEARDRERPPPEGAAVFTGSSSIRFWTTLADDMAPLPVIRRGFGGSRMSDMVHYVDRTVITYRPRAVVLFAGSNDLGGFASDRTPEQIVAGYIQFVEAVHEALPETSIYYLSITPSRLRWKQWPLVRQTNELIEAHTRLDDRLHFVDATDHFLGVDGLPDRKLFRWDRLHPNRRGYEVWTSLIKPVLEAELDT
jgi:lysophospholipase L1-like esterase